MGTHSDLKTLAFKVIRIRSLIAEALLNEVKTAVESVEEVDSCRVDLVFDPPWSKEKLSEELNFYKTLSKSNI